MRNLCNLDKEIEFEGKKYDIIKLNDIDVSKHFEKEKGTVFVTHRIEGFEKPLFLIIDEEENTFFFSYMLEYVNLMVSLLDEDLCNKATELLMYALQDGEN